MTLYEKSLKILELPAILDMLSAEAVSDAAKDSARGLAPSEDFHTVRSLLAETSAAKDMMTLKSSPPFAGIRDVRGAVRRADMGGMLNTVELLGVAQLLRVSAASISYASGGRGGDNPPTAIDYLFKSLISNKALEGKISQAIIAEDEIADTASAELAAIRRKIRLSGERVRAALHKIITSPTYAKALQEPIITMKNDRYVVPVKAEQKSAVPGLVHDISSSGATLFVEPMAAVQINNELRELAAEEKKEIERILMELSADVAGHAEDIISDFETLTSLDIIFAKAKLSYKLNCMAPELSEDTHINLKNARHPLIPIKDAVPINVRLGGEFDTLVITGPNTGGKTVALKTLGLLSAMAQCGLHIPVTDGSIVPVFGGILADIGDEQSIEQSLSTFSSHMTNIVGILEAITGNELLLFDELGAGTDPVEGAALAISIIEYARKRGALIAATTHYAELKTYAVTSHGVINASCEFDVETLRPTYRLIIGIPGKSNAFAISQRLGLPEAILDDARARVASEDTAFEDVLTNLESTRLTLEHERQETAKLLRAAEEKHKEAEEYRLRHERERDKAAVIAKREATQIIDAARKTAESTMAELQDMRKLAAKESGWQKLNEDKAALFRRLNEAEGAFGEESTEEDTPPSRSIVAGDRVKLKGLGTQADVISISPDGVLSLQAGIMKVTAKENEVILIEQSMPAEVQKYLQKSEAQLRSLEAKPELDLRGMMTDEAIPVLERFIDNARLAKLNSVTVIHGKGTGALRAAVHQSLRREPKIKGFRLGRYGEGEDGVTIVEL